MKAILLSLLVIIFVVSGCSGPRKKQGKVQFDSSIIKKTGEKGTEDWKESIKQRLHKNPKNSVAWTEYGNYLFFKGHEKLAELMYDRAIALNKKNSTALNNKGVILYKRNEYDKAMAHFQKAHKYNDFELDIKINLARISLEFSLWKKSKSLYRQIEKNNKATEKQIREARIGLATSYLALGQIKRASSYFNMIEPDNSSEFNVI